MTHVLTEAGLKSWPLAGLTGRGPTFGGVSVLPQRTSVELLGGYVETYAGLYRTQPWVYIVVNKLARAQARLPLDVIRLDTETGAKKREREHPLAEVLRRPYPRGSAFQLKEAIAGSLGIYGHALVKKERRGRGRPPHELWPIPWNRIRVIEGTTQPIDGYEYQGPGGKKVWMPDEVIHFQWWGPEGLGVSPLEPLRRTLMAEDAAQRYGINSFKNATRPSGAFVTPNKMNPKERAELKAELALQNEGVDNAFRAALLTGGLDWKPFGMSAVDAELINLRRLTREEVAAAYDIPPPVIHILDRATFSNIDEQHRMWYGDSLGPWNANVEETWGAQLIDYEASYGNVFVEFDMDDALKADVEKRSQAAQRFFQSAARTPNELRADDRKEPVLGSMLADGTPDPDHPANQVFVPVNMVPISGAGVPTGENAPQLVSLIAAAAMRAKEAGIESPDFYEAADALLASLA